MFNFLDIHNDEESFMEYCNFINNLKGHTIGYIISILESQVLNFDFDIRNINFKDKGFLGKMIKNSEALTGITFFRHLSISCVMLTHRDTQLAPIMRNSCGIVVNFLPKTKQDQKSIRERYLSIGSTKREVETIYHQVFSEKYRALVCEQYRNATTLKEYCSVSTAHAKLRKYKLLVQFYLL